MRLIGIDAGTTSISGVLLNSVTAELEALVSEEHQARIPSDYTEEDLQDPERIVGTALGIVSTLVRTAKEKQNAGGPGGDVGAISVTGQVHGIVYVDDTGRHVSPLYTWQDTRGRLDNGLDGTGGSWSRWASGAAGSYVPPGYGFLTHRINEFEHKVPGEAAFLTTILGYLSMRLSGSKIPRLDATDAHSLGCFDLPSGTFDVAALDRLGISKDVLPVVTPSRETIGTTREGIPIFPAVGDNQASCIGAIRSFDSSYLVGIGTSAQISVYSRDGADTLRDRSTGRYTGWLGPLELRPFPGGGTLISGASIAGGSSYKLLEQLFRNICITYGGKDPGNIFQKMNSIPYDSLQDAQKLTVETQFLGTRQNPDARGRISGIGKSNLTPDYLVEGFLRGIVGELKGFFQELPRELRNQYTNIVGVGNALRRNPLLKRILQDELGLSVLHPVNKEEAAVGAAIIAGVGAGVYENYTSEKRPVPYEDG